MSFESSRHTAQSEPAVLSVSALNRAVSQTLERTFPLIWVSGEVSNFTRAASGHWYFTLKDDNAQVRAVMFKGRSQHVGFMPREGDRVEVRTLVTLYAPRGDYQLNVEAMRRAGVGNLYEAFLRLKETLDKEGLFAAARKRPLPAFARTIGIVSSPQAAALRDILTTLRRRAPHVQVILYPTPVQGEGAADKIATAILTASQRAECDVLLVCRGGGSIEDLWSFNEEQVARAIAACAIPVISGVGHETDFTIADFTADLRAPTPTAAAELATTSRADLLADLQNSARDLSRAMKQYLGEKAQTIDWLSRRLISPDAYIRQERLKLTGLQTRINHAMHTQYQRQQYTLTHLHTRLKNQLPQTRTPRLQLASIANRLTTIASAQQTRERHALHTLETRLSLLSPKHVLARGYAMITNDKGKIIRSPAELKPHSTATIHLAKGSASIGIENIQPVLDTDA
jgi:exodeoxyribonuclease VII large subunit